MCYWKAWIWPGILTVFILSVVAIWMKASAIEEDLAAKSAASLASTGNSWAKVEMDGRDATLTGDAPSESAQSEAQLLVDQAYSVRIVQNQTGLLAAQSPYVLQAKRNGQTLTLSGFVPDEATRSKIVTAAQESIAGVEVKDQTALARGAPENLTAMAAFGFSQLSDLGEGEVSLSDQTFSIKGKADSFDKYATVTKAINGVLPGSAVLEKADITSPSLSPYVWGAKVDGSRLNLTGYVPDQQAADSVLEAAKSILPSAEINSDQKLASGESKNFSRNIKFALKQLTRLSSGSVELSDNDLAVKGLAKTPKDYQSVLETLKSDLPDGVKLVTSEISPPVVSPYVWEANHNEKTLDLNGFVPSEEVRASVISTAKRSFPNAILNDSMVIADGAPKGFEQSVQYAFDKLPTLTSGIAELSDGDLTLKGTAKTAGAFNDLISKKNAPLGIPVDIDNVVPPAVSPYSWGANYDGAMVSLSGFVPNNSARAEILSEVERRLPKVPIVDEMQIAAGEHESFIADAKSSIAVLPRLSKGSLSLSGRNLTVVGVGKTSGSYLAATQYLQKTLPGSINLVGSQISPPIREGDYNWSAKKTENSLVLSGLVSSKEKRREVARFAAQKNPGLTVVNRMTIEDGAPDNFYQRTERGLSLLGQLKTGETILKNEELLVSGTANSVASYEAALQGMDGVSGIISPASVSPYSWSIEKRGDAATLNGFVPNLGISNINLSAAEAVLDKQVKNEQRVAAGAPDGFGNAVAALMTGVSRLKDSKGSIADTVVTLRGRAGFQTEAEVLEREIGALLPKNYTFRSQISYPLPEASPQVVLKQEFVPDSLPEIVLKQEFVPAPVPDPVPEIVLKQEFVPAPVPDPVPEVVLKQEFVPAPVPDPVPEVVLKQEFVPAPVPDPVPEIALKQEFVPAPVPDAPSCNVDFDALFLGEKIQFDTARAVIKAESFNLLTRIANGLKKCADSKIEIAGHTDARGSQSYNQSLSEARANAVRRYMISEARISADALQAKGYGELRPIAPNTVAERSKNRRIEFKVIE